MDSYYHKKTLVFVPAPGWVGAVVTHLRWCTTCGVALFNVFITVHITALLMMVFLTTQTSTDYIHHVLTYPLLQDTEKYKVEKPLAAVSYSLWANTTYVKTVVL